MRRTLWNLIVLFLLISSPSSGQTINGGINDVAVKLIRGLRSEVAENIFVHTDKSVYRVGETIWFNAYLINKISRKLSHYSKVLFIDLVDDDDSTIIQLVLDPTTLRLDGGIPLPVELKEGKYWLRAYTPFILRNDSSDICVHPIYIVNAQNRSMPAINEDNSDMRGGSPRFEFYPEGGSVVAGVNSNVAFHVTDENNNPIEVEGVLKDNHDSVTTRFKTSMTGYGKFSFFPWSTRQYRAIIKTKEGKEFSFPLPTINSFAASISVLGEDQYAFKVLVSLGDSLYDRNATTYLLGISRDSLCYAGIGQRMYQTDIPKKGFPQGEATLLLFDVNKKLLSERTVYVDKDAVIVNVIPDKADYPSRQNVVLNLSLTDELTRPSLSLLTASVTDNTNVRYFDDDDINSIIGKSMTSGEMDLMMIAQKRKYRHWNYADSMTTVATSQMDSFFNIHGVATNQKGKPLNRTVITLISGRPENILKTDTTDETGHFNFPLTGYEDSTQFMLQASDKKGRSIEAKVTIDPITLPRFRTPVYLKRQIPSFDTSELIARRSEKQDFLLPGKGKVLKEVIVKTKVKKPLNYDEKQRVSLFSKIVTPDMILPGPTGIVNALIFIPGVQLRNQRLVLAGTDDEPLLVLDGMEIDTNTLKVTQTPGFSPLMSFLNSIDPQTVSFVEVLSGGEAASYGMKGGNGVIVIHTSPGINSYRTDVNNSSLMNFKRGGFSNFAGFTEPDYTKREIRRNNSPDQRSTIYWSGPLITDANGKAVLNFFTADAATTYTVTIKGITAAGDIFLKRIVINRK